jgi:hypothetical protein
MKIQINTKTKVITLLESCDLTEIENIKEFIGEDWKTWKIEAEKEVVKEHTWYPYPANPWKTPFWYSNEPYIYCANVGTGGNATLNGLLNNSTTMLTTNN